ncbi:hypothetical protein WJX81_001537 [Elliptochloris bilobata]|uniref:Uncharacterized protein n=1 Tax=Elliptochloris bilobata TaxID=381761 RepID=A0AAW1RPQ4_9CHLO
MGDNLLEHMVYVRQVSLMTSAISALARDCGVMAPAGLERLRRPERAVSHEEATVCLLVLQDACKAQHQQHPSLTVLQHALFEKQPNLTFMELVYSSTFERAKLAAIACASLLRDVVLSPATCFALLRLADEAAVPCLRYAALQVL